MSIHPIKPGIRPKPTKRIAWIEKRSGSHIDYKEATGCLIISWDNSHGTLTSWYNDSNIPENCIADFIRNSIRDSINCKQFNERYNPDPSGGDGTA